jgi:hypothetical protein
MSKINIAINHKNKNIFALGKAINMSPKAIV